MNFTKKFARSYIYPALTQMGIEKLWNTISGKSILNIVYHGVAPRFHPLFGRHMSAELFEAQLKYFTRNFDVISCTEAFSHLANGTRPDRKSIVITFDDGYLNNFETALPLLEKHKCKASFCILGMCGKENPVIWADVIATINFFYPNATIDIDGMHFTNMVEPAMQLHLYDYIKKLSAVDRDRVVHELTRMYDVTNKIQEIPAEYWKLLNPEQIKKMSESEFAEIGSHGYLHHNLGNIAIEDAAADMEKSRDVLESITGKRIELIAYPDGNYSEEVKDMAEKLGFTRQLAVCYLFPSDTADKRILNRYTMYSETTLESGMFFMNKAFLSRGY